MSTLNNKIECIKRLISLDHQYELVNWLTESKIISPDEIKLNSKSNQNLSEVLIVSLNKAVKDEKIILLDFEWTILPKEYIKILIVTEKESNSFGYNI